MFHHQDYCEETEECESPPGPPSSPLTSGDSDKSSERLRQLIIRWASEEYNDCHEPPPQDEMAGTSCSVLDEWRELIGPRHLSSDSEHDDGSDNDTIIASPHTSDQSTIPNDLECLFFSPEDIYPNWEMERLSQSCNDSSVDQVIYDSNQTAQGHEIYEIASVEKRNFVTE